MYERTEDQLALAEAVSEFCRELLGPTLKEDDESERFRKEFIHAMGEQGFCGVQTTEEFDGLGLGSLVGSAQATPGGSVEAVDCSCDSASAAAAANQGTARAGSCHRCTGCQSRCRSRGAWAETGAGRPGAICLCKRLHSLVP